MSKQDRQGVRTATDLDRRYDLGGMKKAVNTAVDISAEARGSIEGVANGLRNDINARFETAAQETDEKIADAVEGFVSADVLEDYAKTSDLADYAKSSDLDNYAKSSDLDSYAKKTELDGYAKKTELDNYAKKADLDGYAKASDLESTTRTANSAFDTAQGVANDVNDHLEFADGGTRIKGAINSALIPAGTDLDSLLIPNKYIGGTVTEYNYVNCPVPSGTFSLDVDSCGNQGQFKQTLSYCNKTLGRTYERYYYGASWGEWVCVTDFAPSETSKLLWNEGVYYMTATQTVNLPEAISAQKNGIILVFSEYSGGALDSAIHCFFVHKKQVELFPGKGYTFTLATSKLDYVATKNVFIEDTKILGHADNNATGTGASGIKYTNNRFALRYVIGI